VQRHLGSRIVTTPLFSHPLLPVVVDYWGVQYKQGDVLWPALWRKYIFEKMHQKTNQSNSNIYIYIYTYIDIYVYIMLPNFVVGSFNQIFELIGRPRPNKDNPTPCPYILMQWTEQGGRGLWPRPPCGINNIRIYGHGVGLSLFGLGGPISSNIW